MPEDVNAELARIKQAANKPRFLVSEIFQAVDSPEQDAKVQKDMADLDNQIQLGAPFSSVARQFSQNPTAAQGGDLGWIQEGQLPSELETRLKTMNAGDVTQPIRAVGGYYILQLREKQQPAGSKLPDTPKESASAATRAARRISGSPRRRAAAAPAVFQCRSLSRFSC